ncbi:aspartyl-tRNA synthetase [Cladorrhinum sp. PSN259]|nr:aspartyl-tRNA synthetase [Cladorrhinum sp. PSN259]
MEIRKSYIKVRDVLEVVLFHIFQRCADEIATVRSVYALEPFLPPQPGKEFANVRNDNDMSSPQEKVLSENVRSKFKTYFFVIDKFPKTGWPFYAKIDDTAVAVGDGVSVTNAFDFFARIQEILSGAQQINDAVELEARMRAKGVELDSAGTKEYLAVFRSVGIPLHGGGGIGLDRLVAWYLGLPSVHLAAYYPRTPKRLSP